MCEFDKSPYLSVLISINIVHYIIWYFIVLMLMYYELHLCDIKLVQF